MIKEFLYICLGFIIALWKGDEIINWLVKLMEVIF